MRGASPCPAGASAALAVYHSGFCHPSILYLFVSSLPYPPVNNSWLLGSYIWKLQRGCWRDGGTNTYV